MNRAWSQSMKDGTPGTGIRRRGFAARGARTAALSITLAVLAGAGWAQPAAETARLGAATAPAVAKSAPAKTAPARAVPAAVAARPADDRAGLPVCSGDMPAPVAVNIVAGKSTLIRLPRPITLRTLADNNVAQARLLSPQTLYILGVSIGSTNMVLQDNTGACTVVDVAVGIDADPLKAKLAQLMPDEKRIAVTSAADTLVLSGEVSDALKVEYAVSVATAYVRFLDTDTSRPNTATTTGARAQARVINMLSVASPQQVMLEVKVAEVSKQIVEKLGAELQLTGTNGDWTYGVLSGFLSGSAGMAGLVKNTLDKYLTVDAEKRDSLVKILAQPTVMAISGQEGSFLAGGKVYLPVAQSSSGGATTITLEEKEFGVGLKFTPTVLAGGRINLRVAPEVSEFSREGIAVSAPNVAGRQILPLITTRRATTTVQLLDGQSLVIGGLIKSNAAGNVKAFPILGELPVIGALFRSSDFATERSEVLFVVTPRLARPIVAPVQLPTDAYVEPNRVEFFLGGRLEGTPPAAQSAPAPASSTPAPAPSAAQSGFELK
jgi:pilus assembly protein CpaC